MRCIGPAHGAARPPIGKAHLRQLASAPGDRLGRQRSRCLGLCHAVGGRLMCISAYSSHCSDVQAGWCGGSGRDGERCGLCELRIESQAQRRSCRRRRLPRLWKCARLVFAGSRAAALCHSGRFLARLQTAACKPARPRFSQQIFCLCHRRPGKPQRPMARRLALGILRFRTREGRLVAAAHLCLRVRACGFVLANSRLRACTSTTSLVRQGCQPTRQR